MREIRKVIIHCSASHHMVDADTIRKFHMRERGFKDIGYHFVVRPDGQIDFGRKESEVGAHALGHNGDSLGICLGGVMDFTAIQLRNLRTLIRSLLLKYGLTEANVYCHYELDTRGKSCPNIPANLLRDWLKKDQT